MFTNSFTWTSVTNQFDALNRLTNRLDGLGQTKYTYAVLGNGMRTFREDGPWSNDDVILTNRYGLCSALAIAQPSGQFLVTNAWDAAGRWAAVGGTAGSFTYAYRADSASSLPVAISLPGGGYITNQYDTLARLTRTELRTSGGSILNAYGYQYNLAHQRTLIGRTNSALSTYNGYISAEYDPASQLVKAWTYKPDGTPVTSQKWSYGYDPAQNLVKRTNNTTVETFTVNVLNQLTSIPDSTPTYDRRGNLVSRVASGNIPWKELYYTYDHENRLTCVQTDTYYTPESYRFKVEFVYDGQGRMRIKRNYIWSGGGWYGSGGETRYLYDLPAAAGAQAGGLLIVQERDSGNVPTVTHTRGRDLSGTVDGAGGIGGLLARSHGYSSGSWTYHNFYHSDGNGNVTALVNGGGTLQASYIYDPYGRYLSGTGTLLTSNVMRFSSKPWVSFLSSSATSGLYYYGYRFYDPYLQRWLNRDPIPMLPSSNLYEFAQNASYLYRDSWGLSDELDAPFGPRFTTGNPLHPVNCEQLEALIMDLERNAVAHELYGGWAQAYLDQLLSIWDDFCDDDDGGSECPDVGPAPVPQLQLSPTVFSASSLRNAPSWTPPWQQPCLTASGSLIIVGGAIVLVHCWVNPVNGPLPP